VPTREDVLAFRDRFGELFVSPGSRPFLGHRREQCDGQCKRGKSGNREPVK
jgi:hypothetical protein